MDDKHNMLDRWLRTTQLPDGRDAFGIWFDETSVYVCCDYKIIERANAGLPVPNPGEDPAPDGYETPWERVL